MQREEADAEDDAEEETFAEAAAAQGAEGEGQCRQAQHDDVERVEPAGVVGALEGAGIDDRRLCRATGRDPDQRRLEPAGTGWSAHRPRSDDAATGHAGTRNPLYLTEAHLVESIRGIPRIQELDQPVDLVGDAGFHRAESLGHLRDERGGGEATLAEHLHAQIGAASSDRTRIALGRWLIDQLDEAGYLPLSLVEALESAVVAAAAVLLDFPRLSFL